MNNKYEDIINMKHHTSLIHPRMSMESRAFQFAPFAALTGYEDDVTETARLTNEKIEIDDCLKEMLNNKLLLIENNIQSNPSISFTYFVSDKKKSGGEYITKSVHIKRIDKINLKIITKENIIINIEDIIDISSNDIKFSII